MVRTLLQQAEGSRAGDRGRQDGRDPPTPSRQDPHRATCGALIRHATTDPRHEGLDSVMATNRLVRPRPGKWIAGVCAGLAERFGISTFLVRVGLVIFGLVGAAARVYIAAGTAVPKEE